MILPLVVADAKWCGPVTATFLIQFAGDPYDAKRNDVKVVFLGDKSQREERPAYFDPDRGAWRAILFTATPGRYRPKLVRNGKDALTDSEEGILDLRANDDTGLLPTPPRRPDRLVFDTGNPWVGVGADLGKGATVARVDALADAGANWVRIAPPDDPFDPDALDAFGDAMDEAARRGLRFTFAPSTNPSDAWRRYVLARFGGSPWLLQWEAPIDDPWKRPVASTAVPWPALFEDRPGPFLVKEGDTTRMRALHTVVEKSGWSEWRTPQVWKVEGAKGVGDGNRLIAVAAPGAKLTGLPLADGTYDLTTIDPATSGTTTETARVARGSVTVATPGERFFVLQRKV